MSVADSLLLVMVLRLLGEVVYVRHTAENTDHQCTNVIRCWITPNQKRI